MDARCVDRPAAVLRGSNPALDHLLADHLVRRGYDVHLSTDLLPAAAEVSHPRLHPGRVGRDGVPDTLAPAAGRGGAPVALVVGAEPGEVTRDVALLHDRMGPLRAAGVLVLDPAPTLFPRPTRRTATSVLDPRVTVVTVTSAGLDPSSVMRSAGRALERLLSRLARAAR